MRRFTLFVCLIVAVALFVGVATATVPRLINYQGILTDDTGTPITGTHDLTFTIYPDSTLGATVLWSELHSGVEINAGLFNVILGKTVTIPDSLLADGDRWMGITVDGGTEMTPRMQLTSVPWALRAAVAVGGGDHAATHQNGGADELNVAGLSGVLADPQTPATHAASHSDGSSDPISHDNLAGISADDHHSNANDPTASEKAALVGEGTPSGTNKYTTKSYVDGHKQVDIASGSKAYNDATAYTSGTGFVIDVSGSITTGFTLTAVIATGHKTDLGGTAIDEPALNLLPKVNGPNIEIRVWDAGGTEYDEWSNQRAHLDYVLFMKK